MKETASAPEECFCKNIEIDPVDMLSCILARAHAITLLIECNGDDQEGFALRHDFVMEGLWALKGMLNEAKQVVRNHM
jgi:hypothetical protein